MRNNIADTICRQVSDYGGCEDCEDRVGYWACLWAGAGCGGGDEGETAGLCGVYNEGREAERGQLGNGGHLRNQMRLLVKPDAFEDD
jgi:hypothetical protein